MNETWIENIDKYLNHQMNRDEQLQFESELATDKELASIFNVYRTIETEMNNDEKYKSDEAELKNSIEKLNAKYFKSETKQPAKIIQLQYKKLYKIIGSIAAGVILILGSYFIFFSREQNGRQLAENYISTHFMQLSPKMDGNADSLQKGITAYNNKDYKTALQLFKDVAASQPENSIAKEYTGLAYLMRKDYNSALNQFNALAATEGLYSNPGMFLKAVTLLQRNKEGDAAAAKKLLQQVVKEKLEGSKEAEDWLEEM